MPNTDVFGARMKLRAFGQCHRSLIVAIDDHCLGAFGARVELVQEITQPDGFFGGLRLHDVLRFARSQRHCRLLFRRPADGSSTYNSTPMNCTLNCNRSPRILSLRTIGLEMKISFFDAGKGLESYPKELSETTMTPQPDRAYSPRKHRDRADLNLTEVARHGNFPSARPL